MRKQRGSAVWQAAALRLARWQAHVANIRRHQMHGLSDWLTENYACVAIENLDVPGMIRNSPALGASIRDVGFGKFRHQMEYKANLAGSLVVVADRYFPSTRRCSSCGVVNRSLD